MDKNLRDECIKCLKAVGHLPQLGVFQLMQLLEADAELAQLKSNLMLHASVMQPQDVVMLSFKYDELKQDLAAKVKLIDAIWTVVRKHGYEYGPLNEVVGQMVHDILEQREELKKELEREKGRLDWVIQRPNTFLKICHNACGGTEIEELTNTRSEIDAAQAKEGAK